MHLALFGFALIVSVALPAAFFLAAPVPERRAVLGFTYATVVVIGWCAALTLGLLSPFAAAGAAALLSSLAALAGLYSWWDERLLAELDRSMSDPVRREAALAELRARLDHMGRESRAVVALMEVAAFPVQRLIARGLYDEARALLGYVAAQLGPQLGRVDASEHRLLTVRTLLQLGEAEAARELLARERADSAYPADADLLAGLLAVCDGDCAGAEPLLVHARPRLWTQWSHALADLVEAHVAAAAGDDERALERLRGLPESYRSCVLALARAVPGPATELARRVEGPSAPYR